VTDGNAWKAAVLAALSGLSTAGMPSGGVIYWTGANCPTGYNTMNGLAGTADARGVYIRGLDTGGSVDPGRTLASYQADQFITHTHGTVGLVAATSATSSSCYNCTIYPLSVVQSGTSGVSTSTYGMNSIGGQPETRPSSVTVLFCQKQ
jgi:hypothetical protein